VDRQREIDNVCKKLADVVDPFAKEIEKIKASITDDKSPLEEQLKFVDSKISLSSDTKALHEIEAMQKRVDDAGIANNPHSVLTALDAKVMWDQYCSFLAAKKKNIEEEITARKNRGVTPEQLVEIKQQFTVFDKSGDGKLDRLEVKSALYSLGDERGVKEVKAMMAKYPPLDDPNHLNQDGFVAFMVSNLGDTDTKEEILNGFAMVNGEAPVYLAARSTDAKEGKDSKEVKERLAKEEKDRETRKYIVRADRMGLVMDDWTIAYIQGTAPRLEDGWNYRVWTESVFSR